MYRFKQNLITQTILCYELRYIPILAIENLTSFVKRAMRGKPMNSYIANDVLAYINDCVCVYIYILKE